MFETIENIHNGRRSAPARSAQTKSLSNPPPDLEDSPLEKHLSGSQTASGQPSRAPSKASEAFSTGLPVRLAARRLAEISTVLHAVIGEFVESNLRTPAGIGFLAQSHEPANVEPLLKLARRAIDEINPVVLAGPLDAQGIYIHNQACTVRDIVQHLRLYFMQPSLRDGVGEDMLLPVLECCMAVQSLLTKPMTDLNAFVAGLMIERPE